MSGYFKKTVLPFSRTTIAQIPEKGYQGYPLQWTVPASPCTLAFSIRLKARVRFIF